ncbi:MAG TPA: hypothetical protein VIL08_01925, partial [Limnochorda sp.]
VKLIQESFPGREFSETNARVYADFLKDLPAPVALQAVRNLVATRAYGSLPTIGEIRREAARLLLRAPSPAEAVEEVREQIRTVGVYGSPTFSHPLVARAVAAADWRHLCLSEDPVRSMSELRRLYEDLLDTWTARVQTQGVSALTRLGVTPPSLQEPQARSLPGGSSSTASESVPVDGQVPF